MAERAEQIAGVEDVDLSGRTILVTGSTDGIGREIALALGRLGAVVLVHGRDPEKGRRVVDRIDASGGDAALFVADFADLDEVRGLVEAVPDHAPLAVLVNNAGGYFRHGRLTSEGFEYSFGVNHLAPFLLSNLLRPHLADDARIVTTASAAHRGADGIDFESVQTTEGYSARRAYARSKLANVLFTAALARRVDDATANCYHPGFVPGSAFLREFPLPVRVGMRVVESLPDGFGGRLTTSPVEGASTAVYLAASPSVSNENGQYFEERAPATPSSTARDRTLQERLWKRSVEWTEVGGCTGVDGGDPPVA